MTISIHELLAGTGICTLAYLEETRVVSVEHPKKRERQMSIVFALFPTHCFKSLGPNSWLLLVRDFESLYKILFAGLQRWLRG